MSASTGPILAAGAITIGNAVVLQGRSPVTQTRVVIGSVIAAGGLYLWEQIMPRTATAVSWLILVSVLFVRVEPNTPAPLENLGDWYQKGA